MHYHISKNGTYLSFSENVLCSGDHVSWHTPLDGSESRIQHMLMTEDTQLQPTTSVLGVVNFIQVMFTISQEPINCMLVFCEFVCCFCFSTM